MFPGAYDPASKPVGFMERLTRIMPTTKDLLHPGDFRDRRAIEAWAGAIARDLATVASAARG